MTAPESAVEKAASALDRLDARYVAMLHAWWLSEDPATARTPPTPVTNADRARAALDAVWPEALGKPGPLGSRKATAVLAEVERLSAAVEAVRALHVERPAEPRYYASEPWCFEDGEEWPCPTVRALDGETKEGARG